MKNDIREIGLKDLGVSYLSFPGFGIKIVLTFNQDSGSTPSITLALLIFVSLLTANVPILRRTIGGMLSMPGPLKGRKPSMAFFTERVLMNFTLTDEIFFYPSFLVFLKVGFLLFPGK